MLTFTCGQIGEDRCNLFYKVAGNQIQMAISVYDYFSNLFSVRKKEKKDFINGFLFHNQHGYIYVLWNE